MSELKTRFIDDTYVEYYNTGKHDLAQVYLKSEADAVIAEKDKEISELKEFIENYRFDNKNMFHKIMNQDKKIRRLKRALYKACAMWADRTRLICSVFGSNEPKIRWERMYGKCRAMAERYMEGKA